MGIALEAGIDTDSMIPISKDFLEQLQHCEHYAKIVLKKNCILLIFGDCPASQLNSPTWCASNRQKTAQNLSFALHLPSFLSLRSELA
jgi:hypothetical protein